MTLPSSFPIVAAPPPAFGHPLPIEASPSTLAFLARRRSASAMALAPPGPSDSELAQLLALAARAPDHGKLHPWRFLVLRDAAKAAFVEALRVIAGGRADAHRAEAKLGKIRVPPLTVVVVSRFIEGDIAEWEQRLSAGAVCTMLVLSAQAMGYGANWITDWYAYDEAARRLLGLQPQEKVAGFIHMGTAAQPPLERVRPDLAELVEVWTPQRPA